MLVEHRRIGSFADHSKEAPILYNQLRLPSWYELVRAASLRVLALCIPFERAQAAAKEIAAAVEKGKLTEIEINVARELYRKQATEGAMLYFLLTKL